MISSGCNVGFNENPQISPEINVDVITPIRDFTSKHEFSTYSRKSSEFLVRRITSDSTILDIYPKLRDKMSQRHLRDILRPHWTLCAGWDVFKKLYLRSESLLNSSIRVNKCFFFSKQNRIISIGSSYPKYCYPKY